MQSSKPPEPPTHAGTLKPSAGPSTTEGSENHEHSTGAEQQRAHGEMLLQKQ
jgi:hypothetical protein